MFCRFCGQEIEDNSKFCNKCGKLMDAENMKPVELRVHKGISKKLIIPLGILSVVVLIVLFVYNSMFGVTVVNKQVEAVSVVVLKDIIHTKSANASIIIEGSINTNKLGNQTINCEIVNGAFTISKKVTIRVVDTQDPVITGPKTVTVPVGKSFNPEEYFTVEDFEEDLVQKIEVLSDVDLSSEGSKEVTLKVVDSSGNKGELTVTVKVIKLTSNEEKVLAAIKQYLADGYPKSSVLSSAWIMKTSGATNGVDYYVELTSDKIYAIYTDGSVSEYTVSDCGGSMMHELMLYAVIYDGTAVSTSKLVN